MKTRILRFIFVLLAWMALSCKEPVIVTPPEDEDPILPDSIQLRSISSFPVGMQAYIGILDYPVPAEVVIANYNSYTAASFYWNTLEPTPGNFDFSSTDKSLDFTQSHQLRTFGHALIYFQQGITPTYIENFAGTRDQFEEVVKLHIQTIVNRYKGKIAGYDVVNEMVDDYKGTRYFNNTLEQFYQTDEAYEGFIGKCFTWAHEADSNAKLFYNEARLEMGDHKRLDAVITLVNNLKSAGVPIDGLGTQMHTDIYCPLTVIDHTLTKLAETGLLIHISELDVSVNANSHTGETFGHNTLSAALSAKQKTMYKSIVYSYRKNVPDHQKWGITLWDLMDHTSWLNQYRKEWPCLHDENADKKPAYFGFAWGLLEE